MNRKSRNSIYKFIPVSGVIALAVLTAILYPRYRNFVDEDNAETCYDARYWTGVRYQQAIRSALEGGTPEEEIDYEQILRESVAANFTYDLDENLISDNLCRGGGSCTFCLDPITHSLSIDCDQEGHDHYDDSDVTDELMDYVTW